MPYQNLRHLWDEDLASVVVYIRSLAPLHSGLPETQIPFPVSRLIQSASRCWLRSSLPGAIASHAAGI